jgi:glutathione S-transferase
MLLYNSPASGNCYKVRLLLAHLDIPYETREVSVADRSNRRELLGELNPSLRVPTLVLDDGRPLAESNAILWYFGNGTRFIPTTTTSARRCCSGCSSSSTRSSLRSRSFASGSCIRARRKSWLPSDERN